MYLIEGIGEGESDVHFGHPWSRNPALRRSQVVDEAGGVGQRVDPVRAAPVGQAAPGVLRAGGLIVGVDDRVGGGTAALSAQVDEGQVARYEFCHLPGGGEGVGYLLNTELAIG